MKMVNYKLKTLSPVVISRFTNDDNEFKSENFIPGGALLGAFSNIIGDSEKIKKVFFDSRTYILNSYPSINKARCLPTPKTLATKKHTSGEDLKNRHFGQYNGMKGTKAEFVLEKNGMLMNSSPIKVLRTHNFVVNKNILEKDDISKKKIFSYSAIDKNQEFVGSVLFSDIENAQYFLKIIGKKRECYIGRSKNTEYGRVEIEFDDVMDFKKEYDENSDFDGIVMTFLSDAMLLNEDNNTTGILNLQTLKRSLNLSGIDIKIEKAVISSIFSSSKMISGYNAFKGLPVSNSIIIEKGTSLKIDNLSLKKDEIEQLVTEGIGLRKNEGYGRIAINWKIDTKPDWKMVKTDLSSPKSDTSWTSIKYENEAWEKAVFMEQIMEIINSKVITLKPHITKLSSSQMNNIRDLVVYSRDIREIKSGIASKRGKKLDKEGKWEINYENFESFLDLFEHLTNKSDFFKFIDGADIPSVMIDKYHINALKLFVEKMVK